MPRPDSGSGGDDRSGSGSDPGSVPDAGDGDRERLTRLLGDERLVWLVARVRRRLELGRALTGLVTLAGATDEQRAAVARLLGRRPRLGTRTGSTGGGRAGGAGGGGLSVRLEDVDAVLRSSEVWPAGLADAVVVLTGPVVRRVDAYAAERRVWDAAWAPVEAGLADRAALLGWWRGEVERGLPRRLAVTPDAAAVLGRDLLAVLDRLPAPGTAIGSLAHAATGSAHGRDAGPLATLVLRAARVVAGLPPAPADRPRTAAGDRETWAAVGVVRDELSSTVLTLGLPAVSAADAVRPDAGAGAGAGVLVARVDGGAASPTGAALAAWAGAGQPVVLTVRHLRLDPPVWRPAPAGGTVWVCENPVVLAAVADAWAERAGAGERAEHLPAVVCTAGQPSAAAVAVLRGLAVAGWTLRHHGDLDPDGVRITNRLVTDLGAEPWRMGTADYEAAVVAGLGRASTRVPAAAVWDEHLAPAMARAGQVVEEEAVLDMLVADVVG